MRCEWRGRCGRFRSRPAGGSLRSDARRLGCGRGRGLRGGRRRGGRGRCGFLRRSGFRSTRRGRSGLGLRACGRVCREGGRGFRRGGSRRHGRNLHRVRLDGRGGLRRFAGRSGLSRHGGGLLRRGGRNVFRHQARGVGGDAGGGGRVGGRGVLRGSGLFRSRGYGRLAYGFRRGRGRRRRGDGGRGCFCRGWLRRGCDLLGASRLCLGRSGRLSRGFCLDFGRGLGRSARLDGNRLHGAGGRRFRRRGGRLLCFGNVIRRGPNRSRGIGRSRRGRLRGCRGRPLGVRCVQQHGRKLSVMELVAIVPHVFGLSDFRRGRNQSSSV